MKSILVPIGGSSTDETLLKTALAAARPFSGHLQFLHVNVGAGEAAAHTPHAEFAMGPALSQALRELDDAARTRSATAAQHFSEFCARSMIAVRDTPERSDAVTASWQADDGHALKRIMLHARHHDLVVVGRARKANGLPADFLEQLLIGCGRPVLISNSAPPSTLIGTIMVCWKDTPEAARAVGAAMPFLTRAQRVVVVSVAEDGENLAESINDVARQLAWNGIDAETRIIAAKDGTVPALLASAAQECGADLVVAGAYGRSRMHEVLFGSCTQSMVRKADRPVLLMH
jgi:nucleotide-binding universal stress UspA family protein